MKRIQTLHSRLEQIVQTSYNLLIGKKTASRLKKVLGNISRNKCNEVSLAIYGRDVLTGLPQQVVIDKSLVVEAMSEGLDSIVEGIKVILERTPPEIASDIIDTGIYIVGGSATIQGIDELVREHTGLRVNVSDDPENMVIAGIGKIIESQELDKAVCKIVK